MLVLVGRAVTLQKQLLGSSLRIVSCRYANLQGDCKSEPYMHASTQPRIRRHDKEKQKCETRYMPDDPLNHSLVENVRVLDFLV